MKNRRRSDSMTVESRVAALEAAVSHIEDTMSDIKHSIKEGLSDLYNKLDDQQEKTRPHVAGWAGWAAVMLVIVSMLGSGYVRDIERIEKSVNQHATRLRAIEGVIPAISTNTINIRELDSITQRTINSKYTEVMNRVDRNEKDIFTLHSMLRGK